MKYFFLLFFLLLSNTLHSKTLILATNENENFPAIIGNSTKIVKPNPGIIVEYIQILSKQLKVKIEIKRYPWKRCMMQLHNGKIDAVFFASYNKKREQIGVYPTINKKPDEAKRAFSATYNFYKLKSTKIEWDGIKLNNFNDEIGVPLGYSIGAILKKNGHKIYEYSRNLTHLIEKLKMKKIKLIASMEHDTDYLIKMNPDFNNQIKKIQPPILTTPYYLLFSHQFIKENRDLAGKMWNTIEDIRKKHYPALFEKYMNLKKD